ncbi:MAG: hypothetical protein ACE5K8_06830 [Candidatus Zixiibacteriota bacterium]
MRFSTLDKFSLRHILLAVFLTALIPRLIFFLLMVNQVPSERLVRFPPDVEQYVASANAIREEFDFDTEGVVIFGPGYPTFLALLGFLLMPNPYSLLLFQIFFSSLGTVLVAAFAFELTENVRISLIAGLLNACSLTPIVLANMLLSETVFFTLMTFGFLLFLKALKTGKAFYFLLTSLLLAAAALTRSAGQFLFLVLLTSAVAYAWPYRQRNPKAFFKKLAWPLITAGLIISVLTAWAFRNERLYGFRQVALAGPIGISKLAILVQAELDNVAYEQASLAFTNEVNRLVSDTENYNEVFCSFAQNRLGYLVRKHPVTVLKVFTANVFDKIVDEWGEQYYLLPRWNSELKRITSWVYKKGLHYRVTLLSLIGAIILLTQKKYQIITVLVAIYVYFALLSGFTLQQSNRIFYPAQLAWTVLTAHPLLFLYERLLRGSRSTFTKKAVSNSPPR